MFWYCDTCNDWGVSDTEVDAAVDKQQHMNAHRFGAEVAAEEEQDEDTVLPLKYAALGITALLGLLSTRWPELAVVLPFVALLAFVVTYHGDE